MNPTCSGGTTIHGCSSSQPWGVHMVHRPNPEPETPWFMAQTLSPEPESCAPPPHLLRRHHHVDAAEVLAEVVAHKHAAAVEQVAGWAEKGGRGGRGRGTAITAITAWGLCTRSIVTGQDNLATQPLSGPSNRTAA